MSDAEVPMIRRRAALALVLAAYVSSACLPSLLFHKYGQAAPKRGHVIRDVPFEKWLARNYCGPACLAMVLSYWGGSISQPEIAAAIYDPERRGTPGYNMVYYPRTLGFQSWSFHGDLRSLKAVIARDIPVIVLTKPILELDAGHYRVVIGFDDELRKIVFHDPFFGDRYAISYVDFLKLWDVGRGSDELHWAVAVVPMGRAFPFPALTSQPLTALNLATAYFRRFDYARSRELWLTARELAPDDPVPAYNQGLASLRMGDADEAVSCALEALALDADNAFALDVLGLAYAEQGKTAEALAALARAFILAPDQPLLREHYFKVRALHTPKLGLGATRDKDD